MQTNKDVQFIHRAINGHFDFYKGQEMNEFDTLVTIPKGTPVSNKTACGTDKNYHFVSDAAVLGSYYKYDLTYHGANVPKEFINV